MPTYAELDDEAEWRAEYEPDALAAFNARLRAHYGLSRANCGSKGDNRHLRGRHRSRNWCLNSRYCTNRSYGTTDARDRRGDGDALRATDVGITGAQLQEACRRLDAAVRAGRLPQLAEWFGTVDGVTVVGWFEGHASSSDSSHLYHLHLGYWTENTNDQAFFDLLYEIITGDDMSVADARIGVHGLLKEAAERSTPTGIQVANYIGAIVSPMLKPLVQTADLLPRLDAILAAALDDDDVTVQLGPEALAEVQALRDGLAALPEAVADEQAERLTT